jgi:hypothetical protein
MGTVGWGLDWRALGDAERDLGGMRGGQKGAAAGETEFGFAVMEWHGQVVGCERAPGFLGGYACVQAPRVREIRRFLLVLKGFF